MALKFKNLLKYISTRELTQKRNCIVTLKMLLIGDDGFMMGFYGYFFSDKINFSEPTHYKNTL